jgi:hypothetical protein
MGVKHRKTSDFSHSCNIPTEQAEAWLVDTLCYSRKVAGSNPDEVIGYFQFSYSFQPYYGLGVDSASNRTKYWEYLLRRGWGRGVKRRPVLEADNLVCKPTA